MASSTGVPIPSVPPSTGPARGLIRWVCTNNPFYVLSAGLFLAGLWISFGADTGMLHIGAFMAGLGSYTLLLAVTAFLLVRFCGVWDDVRTILLVVVLMFVATSVTFDEVLITAPVRGVICYLVGLVFAVAVSEGLLRGIRLRLPAWFRVPYYLILALFFLYPLGLRLLTPWPRSEAMMWGLFSFSPAAGLVFLTLLPAIRRGPAYVRHNGSPWPWPLYPWSLFVFLALAVPARAFVLSWSMHQLGFRYQHHLIFGPYFLVPFGLALAVLLLELGLVPYRRSVLRVALAAPAGLALLTLVGHRPNPMYQEFLKIFVARLGGEPLYLALAAAAGFYAYAMLRRVPRATEALTLALVALALVGPHTQNLGQLVSPQPLPILAAAAVQLGIGLWRRDSWRCLFGTIGLAAAAFLLVGIPPFRGLVAFHVILLGLLGIGAAFDDALARELRGWGAALALFACLAPILHPPDQAAGVPPWAVDAYPAAMAALLAGYGRLVGYGPAQLVAVLILGCWLAAAAGRGYGFLRRFITGLDYLAVSLALFALALLISLGKAGILSRWLAMWRTRLLAYDWQFQADRGGNLTQPH